MLFDDYVLRQIRKIAELVAAIGTRASGQGFEDLEAELEEAYRSLVGMDRQMAERLAPESLARLLGEPRQVRALATLMKAHGDLYEARERIDAASRMWERALALLEPGDEELRAELLERIARAR